MKRVFARRLLPATVAILVACGCDRAPLVAPVASTISVFSPVTTMRPGETADVMAMVVEEAGTPVQDGTLIRFSATLGRVEPGEATTRNGVAHATFTAGETLGKARIVAMSGAAVSGEQLANVLEIDIGITPTATLGLAVAPAAPNVGQPITLTVTPTIATGGEPPVVNVSWGDGTSTNLAVVSGPRTATHVYGTTGTFVITVIAVAERTSVSSTTVTVGHAGVPNVNVIANPIMPARCAPVTFTATATLPAGDTGTIARYDWDIRSGTLIENETISTTGNILSRVFRTTGTKTVTVDVVTADGRHGTSQAQISVRELTLTETCN
jgi:hypothetical protein